MTEHLAVAALHCQGGGKEVVVGRRLCHHLARVEAKASEHSLKCSLEVEECGLLGLACPVAFAAVAAEPHGQACALLIWSQRGIGR